MSSIHTPLCDLLGVRYPIVQTGMGWVAGPRLAAATSNAGGLGILASATMDLPQLRDAIAEMKQRTDKPFGVNLRTDSPDIDDRCALLLSERVKVASFAMAPRADLVKRLRDGGLVVIPSIGAKRHAEKVAEMGVDAVLVQGGEGGGHTGSVPTTLLLPQVVDAVDVPVIAAGGFFDGRGLVAALAYGAQGIAMGTRFLLTQESTVPDVVKEFYLGRTVLDTLVTTKVDGFPHRVLRTTFVDELEKAGRVRTLVRALTNAFAYKRYSKAKLTDMLHEGLAMRKTFDLSFGQMLMAANTPMLLRAAMVEGKLDFGVMASGQVVGVIDDLPTVADVIERIVKEAEATLGRLTT
jgi:NAD(P)H-dependent flavin oxidoreductase YrpB (nitropropane dioxygenase family)